MAGKNYSAQDITILEGLDAVRLRPGMYIGSTGVKGLHHILWEIVDNAVDEAANGFASRIEVKLYKDGSASVEDNGRGIPTDIHPKTGVSGVEVVFTQLHAGGKFDEHNYSFSGGLHGVGASVTNALSEWLQVEVYRGTVYKMSFHSYFDEKKGKYMSGVPNEHLVDTGIKTEKTGSFVRFKPDASVFDSVNFNFDAVSKRLKELAFRCDVPADEREDFIAGMKSINPLPLDSILQILCTMNYVMNGEKLGLSDIRIYDPEQRELTEKLEAERANRDYGAAAESGDEQTSVHNTLAIEQTILNFVRRGDTSALKKWVESIPAVREGILASDQLRQVKNTFIVTATLVSRAAIRGGMDVGDALSRSDAYIRKCELLHDLERIANLQYHMIFDYTEEVEKLRLGKTPTKLVFDVTNYIHHHLSEPITTEEIAGALYLSRSRLSVKFRKETGEKLVDFILKEKTEEAKRLLRYTDKSAAAISAYLGFSSQSHFSRVFKKYADCLPNEYRKRRPV